MKVIATEILEQMSHSSFIRKMFEKGLELKKQYGADKVYDFSLGNPDIPPPARIRDVMIELADKVDKPLGLGYCPNSGIPAFREALAAKMAAQQGSPVKAEHIVVTCGAAGALTSFFRAVLEPGDEVICPAPYFVEYGFYCGHFGGKLKTVPAIAPEFQPDIAAMAKAITPKTRVILINTPNNPTGCVYPRATLEALAAMVNKANKNRERPIYLLSDEPYRFIAYDGVEVPPVLPLSPFAMVLGSFSKSLSMAGERIGYLVANPAMPDVKTLVAAVTMTNRTLGFVNAPVLGQKLAMALIDEGVDIPTYDRRRKAMAKVLTDAGIEFVMPKGAFYFFPKAPGGDDQKFVAALLKRNVLVVPGAGFGYAGHVRISFSVDEKVIRGSAEGFKAAAEELR
jgi:aspartate aminotransferase